MIERVAVAVACLWFSVLALRHAQVLRRRGSRLRKTLARTILFSPAFHYGLERAMLPMAAFGVCAAATVLIPPWSASGDSQLTGVRWWLAGVTIIGMTVSIAVTLAIIYFNRPRWIVPAFMRSEQGITVAWWSRRNIHGARRGQEGR